MEVALSISPKRQQIQYMVASLKLQMSKPNEAVVIMKDSIKNDPKIAEGWQRLQWVYEQLGAKEELVKLTDEAKKNGIEL